MIGDILQPTHLLFVLVVALLVLGPKRLPEVGRALGNGLRDFRAAMNGDERQHEAITDAPGFESYREESLDAHEVSELHQQEPAVVDHAETTSSVASATHEPAPPARPEAVDGEAAKPSSTSEAEAHPKQTEQPG